MTHMWNAIVMKANFLLGNFEKMVVFLLLEYDALAEATIILSSQLFNKFSINYDNIFIRG